MAVSKIPAISSAQYTVNFNNGFYAEPELVPRGMAIRVGGRGIINLCGVMKSTSSMTSGTEYDFGRLPFTPVSRAKIPCDKGIITISELGTNVYFTPNTNIVPYDAVQFSVTYSFNI
mgnify:CR=1 FL=1